MPLNIDWQQILLHMFNFVVLFGGLYFLLYKPIRKFMDGRKDMYDREKEEAETLKKKALALKKEYEELLENAKIEIEDMKREAMTEVEELRAEQQKAAKKAADDLLERTRKEAEQEREKMLHSARKEVRALAEEATERLASQSLPELYESFLDKAENEGQTEVRG